MALCGILARRDHCPRTLFVHANRGDKQQHTCAGRGFGAVAGGLPPVGGDDPRDSASRAARLPSPRCAARLWYSRGWAVRMSHVSTLPSECASKLTFACTHSTMLEAHQQQVYPALADTRLS